MIAIQYTIVPVVQRDASACPPLIDFRSNVRPFCKSINDYDIALIARLHPNEVVLSAAWSEYDWLLFIGPTIAQLRNAGVPQITIIGPVPRWSDRLGTLVYASISANPRRPVPERLPMTFEPDLFDLDNEMRTIAADLKLN